MYIELDGRVYDLEKLIERYIEPKDAVSAISAVLRKHGYRMVRGMWIRSDDTIMLKRPNLYNEC